ncbi:efflux RND transporter periplasmic adaptor subunit [Mangrovimicrobium sediminis]|uniref:Efflux RND transporter periplasmic adaptor subunit n=1 Tax=Mangrovimicrobium sediminis TaxID=2562682 RepID=A0A4Z0LY96_9GAMM|nr:efflux RND transporter periplasmic adaptor subunit [Haliea sp. SAOS-164]TGD72127.1 efflux RND transporter periplasmic adaptor subunit [Haliea sp. SAOS-164]
MASRILKILAPIAVLMGSVGVYALLQASRPEPEKNEESARPTTVYVAEVVEGSSALEVQTQGEVRSRNQIDLVAEVGGRIVAASPEFVQGGTIVPGAALLRMEDTDYRLAVREARARVAEAELAVQQALADQDVARKQLRNDPNPSDLALKKPQVAQARAMLEAAKAGLEQAELDLDRTSVSLPFHGRVAETYVQVGQYIVAGTPLAEVFGTDLVEVRLPLTDAQLAALGLPIGYTAPEGGGLDVAFSAQVAGQRHQWQGRLVRLDASVDPDTRLLYAIAEVADPYGSAASSNGMPLAVGLFVDARIHGRDLQNAMKIPGSALRAGNIVYVVNAEGLLEIRPVDVAHASPDTVVVSGGLKPGEQVVTSAIRNPIQGMALATVSRKEG